jgi:hypothetical protein
MITALPRWVAAVASGALATFVITATLMLLGATA